MTEPGYALVRVDWLLLFADAVDDISAVAQPYIDHCPDEQLAAQRQLDRVLAMWPEAVSA